ncbi:uncharacterized protein L203_104160 [Cryptococcus depauperatus CBS 7841]|uniref:Uncharacterized protein n=1 Tax=Cryptococcus depauperatus CBS 7841 TaxID=1295531 RepID=A0AAJ8M1C4_9TREE
MPQTQLSSAGRQVALGSLHRVFRHGMILYRDATTQALDPGALVLSIVETGELGECSRAQINVVDGRVGITSKMTEVRLEKASK